MYHYFDAITNDRGDALKGYYVRLVDSDDNGVALYADTSLTPIVSVSGVADAAKVDSDGNADFYVETGTYRLDIYAPDSVSLIKSINDVGMNVDMDTAARAEEAIAAANAVIDAIANAGTVGTVTLTAASRSLLAILDHTSGIPAYLRESGREGMFVFDSSDLSAKVTADTAQGLYVAPSSDTTGASGAWKRVIGGEVWFHWFGAVQGSAAGANASANNAAWSAMQTALAALAVNVSTNFQGLYEIRIGLGTYEGSTVWELTSGSAIVRGCGMGHMGSTVVTGGTKLKFYGSGGIRIQSTNTSSLSTGDGVTHTGADKACIRDLGIEGDGLVAGAEAEYHGIHVRGQAHCQNVAVVNFAGDGIRVEANTAGVLGSGSSSTFVNCHAWGCRSGMLFSGNNVGSSVTFGGSFNNNRAWGIDSSGTIGSMFYGCELSNNGTVAANDGVTIGASVVSDGTYRYFVISGQETGASTNAPSGSTTDNTYWAYLSTAGVASGIPLWSSGIVVRAGGNVRGGGSNLFSGCYAETNNQGQAQLTASDMIHGGKLSLNAWAKSTAGVVTKGGSNNLATTLGAYQALSGTVDVRLGNQSGNSLNTVLYGSEPTASPLGHYLFFNSNSLYLSYNASTSTTSIYKATGPSTTEQFGTGANFAHVFTPRVLAIRDSSGSTTNARVIMVGTTAPASGAHGAGEITFNSAPALTGVADWRCSVAGTPGTWLANYLNARADPSTGIGYVTGAGGAVTQATSRTTGVTLNKVCGAITLVSAAGTATWQSFTVTNSTVAATDTVRVVQKSGTDKNMIHVTAVGAGSFEITFATTGGTTTEQPVFNFAVIKAVAA